MADSLILQGQVKINADTIPDGDDKRIPTLGEIAGWNEGTGGGPFIGSLDDVPDSADRLAMVPDERAKLAAMSATQGLTGDAQVLVQAEQIAAIEEADAAAVVRLDALEAADTALVARVDALEDADITHESDISALDTRLDNLEGAGKQWVHGPFMVRNSQPLSNMPAAVTPWTNSLARKVSLWKSSRLFFWVHVGTVDTNTGAAVRHQYTTDLVNDTGWTDFSGADISLTTTAGAGRFSSIIDTPAGCQTQEFVLIRCCGVNGGGNQTPTISFPAIAMEMDAIGAPGSGGGSVDSVFGRTGIVTAATNDYSYDQIAETSTGKKYTATEKTKLAGIAAGAQVNTVTSVHGRGGAVVAVSGDYSTGQLTEDADKKFVTDAALAKLANVPANTTSELADKAALADGITSSERAKLSNAPADTIAELSAKAPLNSPALTGAPTAPTPASSTNNGQIATTAFVKNQPVNTHEHPQSDVIGLEADLADLQNQIDEISVGGATRSVLSVTSATAVNLPDTDVIYIEHTVNANVRIPADWTKKPHTLVLLGNPNTVNVQGATGSGQFIKGASGSGLTFASGTDAAAVIRTIDPDPDTANFPARWRIF